jgi:hypothetical protein
MRDQSLSPEIPAPHHPSETLSDDDLQAPVAPLSPSAVSPSVQWRANATRWREENALVGSEDPETEERRWDMERGVWVNEREPSTTHADLSEPPKSPLSAPGLRRRGTLKRTAWDDLQELILARHAAYRAAKASIDAQQIEDQNEEPFSDN